jgi:hypothetical protein
MTICIVIVSLMTSMTPTSCVTISFTTIWIQGVSMVQCTHLMLKQVHVISKNNNTKSHSFWILLKIALKVSVHQ